MEEKSKPAWHLILWVSQDSKERIRCMAPNKDSSGSWNKWIWRLNGRTFVTEILTLVSSVGHASSLPLGHQLLLTFQDLTWCLLNSFLTKYIAEANKCYGIYFLEHPWQFKSEANISEMRTGWIFDIYQYNVGTVLPYNVSRRLLLLTFSHYSSVLLLVFFISSVLCAQIKFSSFQVFWQLQFLSGMHVLLITRVCVPAAQNMTLKLKETQLANP